MLKIVGGMEVYGFALFGLGTYLHRVHRRHGAWKRGGGTATIPSPIWSFFARNDSWAPAASTTTA